MSEITYTELKDAVVGIMEIDNTNAGRFNVDINLGIAQAGLLNALPAKWLKNAVKTVKGALASGIALYQWPSDFFRLLNIWIDFTTAISATNEGNKAMVYEPDENILPIGDLASANFPFVDIEVEGGYGVYPVPSIARTEGVRIRYVWKLPNPTSSQNCLLNYDLKNLMVYKTVELSALVEEYNLELSNKYGRLYDDELSKFLPKKENK